MTKEKIKELILEYGVNQLKEFGYPDVTSETILTDKIYKRFFKPMLMDLIDNNEGDESNEVIKELISDIS